MQKWLFRGVAVMVAVAIITAGGPGRATYAQEGEDAEAPESLPLTLFSADPDHPALFELLAPDGEPTVPGLQPRLTVSADDVPETPLLYVALENTGWSQGGIGLISAGLDPDERYVALELRYLGMAGYVVREDGQALVFPLTYEPDLDGEGTPGFRLDILIGFVQSLRVFRVVEDGGLMLFARESTLTIAGREQERVTVMIDPEPVFGDLVFECHIQARPERIAATTSEVGTDSDGDGVLDADDVCPTQWGGLPNGCMAHIGAGSSSDSAPGEVPLDAPPPGGSH